MRKSQMKTNQRGFGGVNEADVIVPPAQKSFETAFSPDLDPSLAAMLSPEEYEAMMKHRHAMNGMPIRQHKHYDQVQANAVQKANLLALQRRENQKKSQSPRRERRERNQQMLVVQMPAQGEEYSMGRATPLHEQARPSQARQSRDGRHISSTGQLPIEPPAAAEVKNNLLKGTTWGPQAGQESLSVEQEPRFVEKGLEPLVTSSLGVNLRPENPMGGRERIAVKPLSIGALPADVPTPKVKNAGKKSGKKAGGTKKVSGGAEQQDSKSTVSE